MAIGAVRWRWRAPLEHDFTSTMGPTTARLVGAVTIDSDTERREEICKKDWSLDSESITRGGT